jgi:hypothetical protein
VGIKNEILNMKVSLEIFLSTAAAYNLDFRSVGLEVMYTPNSKRKNLNIPFHLNSLQYSYVNCKLESSVDVSGFHLHLLEFPFVYQFFCRMIILVSECG